MREIYIKRKSEREEQGGNETREEQEAGDRRWRWKERLRKRKKEKLKVRGSRTQFTHAE